MPTNGTRLAQGEEVVAVGVRNAGNVETEATPVITLTPIGGGDSVKAIDQSGYSDSVSFVSTGGGAALEFLEGKEMPGLSALDKK